MTRPPQIPGYQYIADIATGGYSVVYRYRQQSPRRDVAVKVLTGLSADVAPEQRDAEANAMAKLGNHPNIVQVIVADVTADGQHFIIMPYYPGRSLAEIINQGPLAVRKVLRVGIQVAGALDAAHRFGLLHRDIKPANILLDEYGTSRLTDFGIAGWVGPDHQMDSGGLSLPWSPAEVVAGGESRRASDIYSLGATLWHLLVGRPPHAQDNDTRSALEWRIHNAPPPPTGRADVPADLEDLLALMLARTPERRPASASVVASSLQDIETVFGGPVSAEAPWHGDGPVATTKPIPTRQFAQTSARRQPPALPQTELRSATLDAALAAASPPEMARPVPSLVSTPPATGETVLRRQGPPHIANLEPVSEKTQLRAVVTPTEPEPVVEAARTRMGWWLWAGAAVVVCALVVTGIIVSFSGSKQPPTVPISGASQNAAVNELAPGVPTITAKRSGGKLRFSWTYDSADATDTFLWRVSGADRSTVAKAPNVVISDKSGTQLCIQVKVVRSSGGFGTPDWSPEGCGS